MNGKEIDALRELDGCFIHAMAFTPAINAAQHCDECLRALAREILRLALERAK